MFRNWIEFFDFRISVRKCQPFCWKPISKNSNDKQLHSSKPHRKQNWINFRPRHPFPPTSYSSLSHSSLHYEYNAIVDTTEIHYNYVGIDYSMFTANHLDNLYDNWYACYYKLLSIRVQLTRKIHANPKRIFSKSPNVTTPEAVTLRETKMR